MKLNKLDSILYIIVLLTALFVLSQCNITKQVLPSGPYDNIFQIEDANADELTFNLQIIPTDWTINVLKGDYNLYQHKWMNHAWYRYRDKQFMYMMASENGLFNHDRKSLVPNEPSYGFCQIHQGYHPQIVNNPSFWNDPAWQLDQCHKLFSGGTAFYGYKRFQRGGQFATDIINKFNL